MVSVRTVLLAGAGRTFDRFYDTHKEITRVDAPNSDVAKVQDQFDSYRMSSESTISELNDQLAKSQSELESKITELAKLRSELNDAFNNAKQVKLVDNDEVFSSSVSHTMPKRVPKRTVVDRASTEIIRRKSSANETRSSASTAASSRNGSRYRMVSRGKILIQVETRVWHNTLKFLYERHFLLCVVGIVIDSVFSKVCT